MTPLFQDNKKKVKRGFMKRIACIIGDAFGSKWEEVCVLPVKDYKKQGLPFGYLYVSRHSFTGELKGEIITQHKTRPVDLRYYEGQLVARGEAVPWRKFKALH